MFENFDKIPLSSVKIPCFILYVHCTNKSHQLTMPCIATCIISYQEIYLKKFTLSFFLFFINISLWFYLRHNLNVKKSAITILCMSAVVENPLLMSLHPPRTCSGYKIPSLLLTIFVNIIYFLNN